MAETSSLHSLPLFPLETVLFPGGTLPLRVFEVRYLDMIGKCHRAGAPFGVVALAQGHEVRTLYLSGGSCSLAGVGELFADEFPELEIVLPKHPIFLTPFAIAAYQTHATNAGAQQ